MVVDDRSANALNTGAVLLLTLLKIHHSAHLYYVVTINSVDADLSQDSIEDILILHLENGKDLFVSPSSHPP